MRYWLIAVAALCAITMPSPVPASGILSDTLRWRDQMGGGVDLGGIGVLWGRDRFSAVSVPADDRVSAEGSDRDAALLDRVRSRAGTALRLNVQGQRRPAFAALRKAIEAAALIKDPALRDEAAGRIALVQTDLGDFEGAKRTAVGIQNSEARLATLSLITAKEMRIAVPPATKATTQAEAGDIAGALETLNQIPGGSARDYVLERMAKEQARAGDIVGARQLAAAISSGEHLARAVEEIAWVQTKKEDIEGALQTAASIQDANERDSVLLELAEREARRKDLQGARQFATAIQDDHKKGQALLYIRAHESILPH